ncbi:MAG: hypothetical protein J6D79_02855, partial [Clostridia bacterium]|nr:hypothetical protein [Clostridia bacterium]
ELVSAFVFGHHGVAMYGDGAGVVGYAGDDGHELAVVGGYELDFKDYFAPCGVCRQVMAEFCDMSTFKVILGKNGGEFKTFTLEEILPFGFSPQNLKDRTEKDA